MMRKSFQPLTKDQESSQNQFRYNFQNQSRQFKQDLISPLLLLSQIKFICGILMTLHRLSDYKDCSIQSQRIKTKRKLRSCQKRKSFDKQFQRKLMTMKPLKLTILKNELRNQLLGTIIRLSFMTLVNSFGFSIKKTPLQVKSLASKSQTSKVKLSTIVKLGFSTVLFQKKKRFHRYLHGALTEQQPGLKRTDGSNAHDWLSTVRLQVKIWLSPQMSTSKAHQGSLSFLKSKSSSLKYRNICRLPGMTSIYGDGARISMDSWESRVSKQSSHEKFRCRQWMKETTLSECPWEDETWL